MYLLYEHHKDASGQIIATDMLLTSVYPGASRVIFKSASEKAIFELCKLTFKEIHTKERTIDMDTYIWSFFGTAGKAVYDRLKASAIAAAGLQFQRIDNLAEQKKNGYIRAPAASLFDAADFFYQQAAPSSNAPSKEQLKAQLAPMLGVPPEELEVQPLSALKKPYRQAAMRLHPDRNNGDATQMTELNYLWQQWQPYAMQ
jgi:hypothetical protein